MQYIKILLIFCFLTYHGPVNPQQHLKYGYPYKQKTVPSFINGKYLNKKAYSILHDNIKKVPLWVGYNLTAEDLPPRLQRTQKRTDDFRPDKSIPNYGRAELLDYKGSGYDRGHVAPAGDMVRNRMVMSESFLLSNIIPQVPGLNRGIWKTLEEKVRDFTRLRGDAYIMSGPVFFDQDNDGKGDPLRKIGPRQVWVPTHCYKIIVDDNDGIDAVAFVMPNQKIKGILKTYMTTVDKVEQMTGMDFLNILPDNIQKQIESGKTKHINFWSSSKRPSYRRPSKKRP